MLPDAVFYSVDIETIEPGEIRQRAGSCDLFHTTGEPVSRYILPMDSSETRLLISQNVE